MANPQPENGTTRISQEVMEKLLQHPFKSACPLKLCLFVIRKTWGYSKKIDKISITQFQKGTKTSRPTVVYWLDYLVKSLLLVKKGQLGIREYGFNKDWEGWVVKPLLLVKARHYTSKPLLTDTSKPLLTHKRKKETIQKKYIYGELQNVFLTEEENKKLKARFGDETEALIENLSFYLGSKGDKYKSHYATILQWHSRGGTTHKQESTGRALSQDINTTHIKL